MDKGDTLEISRLQKALSPEDRAMAVEFQRKILAGAQVSAGDDPRAPICTKLMDIIGHLRIRFAGRIIRRTPDSLDNNGEKVTKSLPQKQDIMAWIKLTDS